MAAAALKTLEDLPTELLHHIVSILDQDSPPPSVHLLREKPSEALFRSCHRNPLKQLSQTCKIFQSLVSPSLNAHLKVNLRSPKNVEELLVSVTSSNRPDRVRSLLVYSETNFSHFDALTLRGNRKAVAQLMDAIDPKVLTVVASPYETAWLADHILNKDDNWVFKIDYQILRLEQGDISLKDWFPRDVAHDNGGVFTLRPWKHWTYNEGSSIPAYSTYEYHLYEAPTIHQPSLQIELECQALQLGCLRSFELIAVFPFNHMLFLCNYFLRRLPNLESLTVQLAPSLASQRHGLDPSASTSSACQPGDFWRELEGNYLTLWQFVARDLPRLSTYTMLDYASPGYREMIDRIMGKVETDWQTRGDGIWKRKLKSGTFQWDPSHVVQFKCPQL